MENEEKYRRALLDIAATARNWAVAKGGDTPLAIISRMAREPLGLSMDLVDAEVARINSPRAEFVPPRREAGE